MPAQTPRSGSHFRNSLERIDSNLLFQTPKCEKRKLLLEELAASTWITISISEDLISFLVVTFALSAVKI